MTIKERLRLAALGVARRLVWKLAKTADYEALARESKMTPEERHELVIKTFQQIGDDKDLPEVDRMRALTAANDGLQVQLLIKNKIIGAAQVDEKTAADRDRMYG